MTLSLQKKLAPNSICYGCGPANKSGLHIDSFVDGEELICNWTPEAHHHAFPGILNGGIIGTLLDCHSNWTAAYFLMKKKGQENPDCTVTAYYKVTLSKPTPSSKPVFIRAWVKKMEEDRALIRAKLYSNDILTAHCEGLFVGVKEGHPAYHRWN